MEKKKIDYSKRTLLLVGSIALVFSILLSILMLSAFNMNEVTEGSHIESEFIYSSDIDESTNDEYSEETSDINVNLEMSDVQNEEPEHGWIINEFGYTYVYDDSGFQQFNYKQSSLQRYVDCMNDLAKSYPGTSDVYNILVPISTTFADIPREIYKYDNFFNLSQSSFVATVNTKIDDSVSNISIVNSLETAYDNGEKVYFRTDPNWTSLGAYKAYLAFCEQSSIEALPIEKFSAIEMGDFLGSFYRSTSSESMYKNPDNFVCFSVNPEVSVTMTLYDGGMVFTDYSLCNNSVNIGNKYDCYLGRDAGRYSISTNTDGGSLLIIGDSSVAPMLPFLASHYRNIEFINPLYYNTNIEDIFSKQDFDDILTMCYTTNAVSGNYIPSLINLLGVKSDE